MNLFALATLAAFGTKCEAFISFIEKAELTVTTESNTGVGGFMFDVKANQKTNVTIDTILFNFNAGRGSYEYALWYKNRSFVGHNRDSFFWTLACSGNSIEQYDVDFNSATSEHCSFTIPAGQTYGVYIHGISRGLIVEEEGSSFDDIVSSDGHINVYTGLGIAGRNGPFGEGYGDDFYVTPTVKLMYTARSKTDTDNTDEEEPCLGCYVDYDDLESVQAAVDDISDEIISLLRAESVSIGGGPSITVVSAQMQVVAGFNYRVTLNVASFSSSQENVVIEYFVGLKDDVPSNIQLIDVGQESGAKQGEYCKVLDFKRECEEGLVCLPKPDWPFDAVDGEEVPHTCIKPCPGCYSQYDDLDSVQETVDGIADEIVSLLREETGSIEDGAVITVVDAQSQVVPAGTNYRMFLNVGSRSFVMIKYFVALPNANPEQVPSDIQLLDVGTQSKSKQGQLCKDDGVKFERECEKGLICLPEKGVVAIGGEVPYFCQFA